MGRLSARNMGERATTMARDADPALILELDQVSLRFGGVNALTDVSCQVSRGELFSIIGPNGAGKTSMLNCISGRYRPTSGRVVYKGRDITRLSPNKRADLGLGRTFQNLALFNGMSVLDNISVGRHHLMKAGFVRGMVYWVGGARREEAEHRAAVEEIIDFLRDPEHSQRGRGCALVRLAQARRARARHRLEARPHPARRADGRHEPRGEGGHGPLHRRSQRGAGA